MKNLRSRLIFAAIILVVLLNTLMAFYAVNTLVDNQDLQSHTLKVMAQTQGLIAQVRAAESAARGFVLTGDPKFETFYRSSSVSSNQMMDALNTLTHDNVSQQKRIALLRQRVAVKFGALDFGIAARRTQARGEPPMSELGPMLRDTPDNGVSVQYVISQIEGEERRLLAERDRTTLQSEHEAWIALGLASTLDLLFILTAFRLLASAHRSRDELAQQTERIAHLNSELSVANADLESRVLLRTQELEVSNRELEAFSYSVSHDLRAPLRTIDGFSLALEEDFADKLDDDGRDYIRRVRNGVQRMGSLIDALLQLSRVSRSDLQREPVNLSQLATLVFHELQAADPVPRNGPPRPMSSSMPIRACCVSRSRT
jgi:signal transduction histidine kinase